MTIPKIAAYSLDDALAPCDAKVDWLINSQNAVLLVHDMQEYFANFYDCDQEPFTSMLKNMQTVISAARSRDIPVIYTAQPTNQALSDRALLTDFWGAGLQESHNSHHIISAVAPSPQCKVYTKWRYSAFQKSSFDEDLQAQAKNQIIICGVYAHIGILSTALEGFMRDYQCFVIEDAIADFSAQEHLWARQWIAGRCGKVLNTQSVLAQISSTPSDITEIDIASLVGEILAIPASDIQPTDNLADWGLDSMRLMTIADTLKAAGSTLDFMALAQRPSLAEWQAMLEADTQLALS